MKTYDTNLYTTSIEIDYHISLVFYLEKLRNQIQNMVKVKVIYCHLLQLFFNDNVIPDV